MQFYNAFGAVACVLVQSIEVLRDDTLQTPYPLQFGKGVVRGVGFCTGHLPGEVTPCLPVELSGLRFTDEILVAHGWLLQPDGARAAKIRNARFGADASARQSDDALRLLHDFLGDLKL